MIQERTGLPLVEEYGVDVNPGSLTRFLINVKVISESESVEEEGAESSPYNFWFTQFLVGMEIILTTIDSISLQLINITRHEYSGCWS